VPYLAYLTNLRKDLFSYDGNDAILRSRTVVTLGVLWLCSLFAILALLANHGRDTRRVEGLNSLLQAHCASWSVTHAGLFLPYREPILTKCVPK
jgi:hypothetical protein